DHLQVADVPLPRLREQLEQRTRETRRFALADSGTVLVVPLAYRILGPATGAVNQVSIHERSAVVERSLDILHCHSTPLLSRAHLSSMSLPWEGSAVSLAIAMSSSANA